MKRIDENTFVITETSSGRRYTVHRRNRSDWRAKWDVCNDAGGHTGRVASVAGGREWARTR